MTGTALASANACSASAAAWLHCDAAEHDQRPLGLGQQRVEALDVRGRRSRDAPARYGAASATSAPSRCMSSGMPDHDRARPAGRRDVEGAAEQLRDPRARRRSRTRPFASVPNIARQVDLLERLPAARGARHLADQQDQRRRVLRRGVHADAGLRRARAARDEADRRAGPVSLPVASAMFAAPASWRARDQPDSVAVRVEPVEHRQVALARHAERDVGAVQDELVGEQVPAAARHGRQRVRCRRSGDHGAGLQDRRLLRPGSAAAAARPRPASRDRPRARRDGGRGPRGRRTPTGARRGSGRRCRSP